MTRRSWTASALALVAGGFLATASAQDVSPLKPNEAIPIPGGSLSVLSLEVKSGEMTSVNLRMRVLAGPKGGIGFTWENFRLLAAGVPRAPAHSFGHTAAADSAVDFDLQFKTPDRTDDLVLQARFGDTVVKRRLPKR
jgi:hypothetical protein